MTSIASKGCSASRCSGLWAVCRGLVTREEDLGLARVAVAARFAGEQVKQRVAVVRVRGMDGAVQDALVEQGAGTLHRDQAVVVAARPGDIVGPAASVYLEAIVFPRELPDHAAVPHRHLRDQLAHPPIARAAHLRLPPIPVCFKHVLQVADRARRCAASPHGRNRRLMRVQRDRPRGPDPRERIAALSGTGQRGPFTSWQRLRDDLLGSGDVRDPVGPVRQLYRGQAVAACRLHPYASQSRKRLGIPDPGAPTSGPRASR
jgi:hypothetical protein